MADRDRNLLVGDQVLQHDFRSFASITVRRASP